jgi:hypothetical protein
MQYFAYGSNMSLRRLRTRVPSAVKLGNATLFGHQLKFHKRSQDGSAKCDAMTALLDPALQPYHWYKEHVLRGAVENHLAAAYIQAIEEISSIVDPDRKRDASELLIYQP